VGIVRDPDGLFLVLIEAPPPKEPSGLSGLARLRV
jgi:hypothetical protein